MTEIPLQFDDNGLLMPAGLIESTIPTVEQVFVERFFESKTRRILFEQYREYTSRIAQLAPEGFYQWLNGSFVTHKLNPNDIDVVSFIDYQVYIRQEKKFDELRRWGVLRPKSVDGFFVKIYPPEHSSYVLYQSDLVEWEFTWTRTRKPSQQKGFIHLINPLL